MELRQIRYFLAVADELHFGHAAARLHVAQPSLSRQIRDLEHDVGVALFERTSRSVALTTAGRAFYTKVSPVVTLTEEAREQARRAAAGEVGLLRLGFVSSAAVEVLPRLVTAFQAAYPAVHMELHEMTTQEQLAALNDGRVDLSVGRDLEPQDRLTVTTLRREPLLIALPTGHPLAIRHTVRMTELAAEGFVALPRKRVPRSWDRLWLLCRRAGFTPRLRQEANQYVTMLGLVAAGIGVAVVPEPVRQLRRDDVAYVTLADTEAWSEITIAVHANDTEPTVNGILNVIDELRPPS